MEKQIGDKFLLVVTDSWVRYQMTSRGIKLKHIVSESGLNKTYLSPLVNGRKPMSNIVRAFFWYYFLTK